MSRRGFIWLALAVAVTTSSPGCGDEAETTSSGELEVAPQVLPRGRYNEGLASLSGGDWQSAVDAFLQARDEAGTDGELRFRAAFNLGSAYITETDSLAEEDPEAAIEALRRSATWFRDAVRLREGPEGDDARANLEIVLRRIQVLADRLNAGQNSLEARLDRAIDDQRSLRDNTRRLLTTIETSGRDALSFEGEYETIAVAQRTLLADTGTVLDLAYDELGLLEQGDPDSMSDEDRVRAVQLELLTRFVNEARTAQGETRGRLRQLDGDSAHRGADEALASLRRAREQLHDPIRVLRAVTEEQAYLYAQTNALEQLGMGGLRLDDGAVPEAPPWLTDAYLLDQQLRLRPRVREVAMRFSGAVQAQAQQPTGAPPAGPEAVQQQRTIEGAAEALPYLEEADAAFIAAEAYIDASDLAAAAGEQERALEALVEAIERFSDIRGLIELTYADQNKIVALLAPPDEVGDEVAALTTEERTAQIGESLLRNQRRLDRLGVLFQDEVQNLADQAEGGGAQTGEEPDLEALEAELQRYQLAEQLRGQTIQQLDQLRDWLDEDSNALEQSPLAQAEPFMSSESATEPSYGMSRVGVPDPSPVDPSFQDATPLGLIPEAGPEVPIDSAAGRVPAEQALASVEELRRLFFSLIEHLHDLLQQQTETHDQTASSFGLEGDELVRTLGPTSGRQAGHAQIAPLLVDAVAQQADAAASAPPQPGADPEQAQAVAERWAQAADEVSAAAQRIGDAASGMEVAVQDAAAGSVNLEPTMEEQVEAMAHLENAIRLLQPPPPPQEQDQEQQDQQPQEGDQEQLSQRQAEQRLQAAREREAERRRERRERQRRESAPVERDW